MNSNLESGDVVKKIFAAVLVAASLISGVALAQTPVVATSGPYTPLGYCQITSLGSAVALVAASCSSGTVPTGASIAEICVEVAAVRYRDDGTAPTATIGMPVVPSSTSPSCFAYAIKPLSAMNLIAVTGSPIVNVNFYK